MWQASASELEAEAMRGTNFEIRDNRKGKGRKPGTPNGGKSWRKQNKTKLEAEEQCSLSSGVNDTQRGDEFSEPVLRTKLQKAH